VSLKGAVHNCHDCFSGTDLDVRNVRSEAEEGLVVVHSLQEVEVEVVHTLQ
jgi:hypothetical protein